MEMLPNRSHLCRWRADRRGRTVGFVPTMGALHEGHLALVRAARQRTDCVVTSIFVNPTQFGPNEDFDRYPRDLEQDRSLLAAAGCDALFHPPVVEIYPKNRHCSVRAGPLGEDLCGRFRPGHFDAVATVVTILFNLVRPHQAFFGLKDYQQYTLIQNLVRDLAMPVTVVGLPTVREADRLALSSRNRYLNGEERTRATALSRAVHTAQSLYRSGERDTARLRETAWNVLAAAGIKTIDYVEIRDQATLAPVYPATESPILLIAAYVGSTRLNDNGILSIEEKKGD